LEGDATEKTYSFDLFKVEELVFDLHFLDINMVLFIEFFWVEILERSPLLNRTEEQDEKLLLVVE
jgi:hypothetical protein